MYNVYIGKVCSEKLRLSPAMTTAARRKCYLLIPMDPFHRHLIFREGTLMLFRAYALPPLI